MQITVKTRIAAPVSPVWLAYTTPDDIKRWNAASDDWHTTSATVDLRAGGRFCSRMEAKDGSAGFDFEGVYTAVDVNRLIEYEFGERTARVTFAESDGATNVQVTFDSEDSTRPSSNGKDGRQSSTTSSAMLNPVPAAAAADAQWPAAGS